MNFHILEDHQSGDTTHHYADGELVSTSFKNVFGGQDHMGAHGEGLFSTHPNHQGGHDLWHDGRMVGHTSADGVGGQLLHDNQAHVTAHVIPDGNHGADIWQGGHLMGHVQDAGSGLQTLLQMNDPLVHLNLYHMPSLFSA